MPIFSLIGLALLGAGAWLWLDSLKAREACIAAARELCAAEGLLLLDATVAIDSVWIARDDVGTLRLRRVYGFEYSESGNDRHKGSVVMVGHEMLSFHVETRPMQRLWH